MRRQGPGMKGFFFFVFQVTVEKRRRFTATVNPKSLWGYSFKHLHFVQKNSKKCFPRLPRKSLLRGVCGGEVMSQRPAKFGNVVARNQLTNWDRWTSRELSPKQAWEGQFAYCRRLGLGMLAFFSLLAGLTLRLSQGTPNSPLPWFFLTSDFSKWFGG